MFPEVSIKRLKYFADSRYWYKKSGYTPLIETKDDGKAEIACSLVNDGIILNKPETLLLPYLDEQRKGCCRCCDEIIFVSNQHENKYELHVIETKMTMDVFKIHEDIRPQIKMGILNAKAIAAFLGITIDEENIYTYTAVKNDKVNVTKGKNKRAYNNTNVIETIKDWNNGKLRIDINEDGRYVSYRHKIIKLTEDGKGAIVL
mgnify:CR=1 FL=1